jgi:hypothetical protein
MSEHQLWGIGPRPEIGGAHNHWHEVRCSCGWVRKYVSRYRCEVMFEKHHQQAVEMERSAS